VIKKREEQEYFHICLNENSSLVKKLKMAKVTLDCLTYEELLQKMWDICTKIEPALKQVEKGVLK
jgi:hypothetical protein